MLAVKKLVFIGLSLFALTSLTTLNTAHAGLFDDKEARKKILEIETKQQSDHNAAMAAIAEESNERPKASQKYGADRILCQLSKVKSGVSSKLRTVHMVMMAMKMTGARKKTPCQSAMGDPKNAGKAIFHAPPAGRAAIKAPQLQGRAPADSSAPPGSIQPEPNSEVLEFRVGFLPRFHGLVLG